MTDSPLHAVTGALSYTGKYITRHLLAEGIGVRTLTGHPDRPNEFGSAVDVRPLAFENPAQLEENLRGASVLYNTYWIRFERGEQTFARAVANTKALILAAERAGVGRLVHVSIANATAAPHLPYYAGKAELEAAIRASTLSHAIIRPTVIFGDEDILINNIAWILRRFPVLGAPGDGSYRMRPIFVDDMAKLAVDLARASDNVTVDAVGPETFTFDEWLRLLVKTVGSRARILHLPPKLALWASRAISVLVRDVVLTSDEVTGLMADLLVTDGPPTGGTRLSAWLKANADHVGRRYASEVARHYK
jgi:NADH dehydrogenase